MKTNKIYFISKNASWQSYRLEVLTKLAEYRNHKIEILTVRNVREYLGDNDSIMYKTFRSWLPFSWRLNFFPGSLFHLIKNKPYAVICINNTLSITNYLALFICKILGIKFIWWTHAFDHFNSRRSFWLKKFKEKYVVFFLKMGNSIITFSNEGRNYLLKNGISSHKVFNAPNTLDTDRRFDMLKKIRSQFFLDDILNQLNLPKNGRIILLMSQLSKQKRDKRIEDAIRTIPIIRKQIPTVHLVIIGDGNNRNQLESLVDKSLSNNVSFVGAIFDEELYPKYLYVSELFILPGSVGLAIVEAFCFGLPLITEKINSHKPEMQYFKDGYNGYSVDEGDIEGLADIIIKLLSDQNLLKNLSNNASETASTDANINRMIKAMSNAIEN